MTLNTATKVLVGVMGVLTLVSLVLYLNERDTVSKQSEVMAFVRTEYEALRRGVPHIETLQADLQVAKVEIEKLRIQLERAEAMVGVLEDSVDEASATLQEEPEENPGPSNPMRQMIESTNTETLANMQANSVMQSGYRRLLDAWGLEAEKDARVREIIRIGTRDQFIEVFAATKSGDELSGDEQRALQAATRAGIRERLSEVLSAEQLAMFDAYDLDFEMMAGSIEMQLNMMAAGLTEESREVARDVLVEELLSQRDGPPVIDLNNAVSETEIQLNAFRNAEARLRELLDEEQFGYFSSFSAQQMEMIETMMRMNSAEEEAQP